MFKIIYRIDKIYNIKYNFLQKKYKIQCKIFILNINVYLYQLNKIKFRPSKVKRVANTVHVDFKPTDCFLKF